MYYGYQIIIGINAVFLKGLKYVNKYSIPAPAAQRTLEEEMATHSSILAWRIPWTEESGGL